MPRLLPTVVLALYGLLLVVAPARAWGPDGHRIVGQLAEQALTPAARTQVQDLLAAEPEPTLAGVSNWADDIRKDEAWRYTGPWHYLNVPDLGCDYQPPRDCPDGNCVIGAIAAQTRVLADRAQPRQKRVEALKFVVHFVGDVHQPLHAGLRADRGGNDFQIAYRGEGWNLHSTWDSLILREPLQHDGGWQRMSARLARVKRDRAAAPTRGDDAREWAMESCALIDAQHLYPTRHTLRSDYLDQHRPLAEQRLRVAGARLAALLNTVFAAPPAR